MMVKFFPWANKLSGVATAGLAAALALSAPQQAVAQDEDAASAQAEPADPMAELMAMFAVEPLTQEQAERLPVAQSIINQMMPEGSFSEVMGSVYDQIVGPIMANATQVRIGEVATPLGLAADEISLTDEQLAEAIAILDPVRDERTARMSAVMPGFMQEMMAVMEPPMRKAMAEAYAVQFNEQELADIAAFFDTASGLTFARKSLTMSSDPRIIAASFEAMPQIMAATQNMEKTFANAAADLPAVRTFAELNSAEQARLSELLGIPADELAAMSGE